MYRVAGPLPILFTIPFLIIFDNSSKATDLPTLNREQKTIKTIDKIINLMYYIFNPNNLEVDSPCRDSVKEASAMRSFSFWEKDFSIAFYPFSNI